MRVKVSVLLVGVVISLLFPVMSGASEPEKEIKEELLLLLEKKMKILEKITDFPAKELEKTRREIKEMKEIIAKKEKFYENTLKLEREFGRVKDRQRLEELIKSFRESDRFQVESLEKTMRLLQEITTSPKMAHLKAELYFTVMIADLVRQNFFASQDLPLIYKKEEEKMLILRDINFPQ